jgi:hypothetical protein
VEVRIVTDDGRTLPTFHVSSKHKVRKVYAQAVKGDHYRIEVRNRLDRRVGLVVAVDGRNIISGAKSWLKSTERMYILDAYGLGEFSGWRTGRDRVNRFYFTDVPDSYSAAFGDRSAMGVIAVAVYPEVRRYEPPPAKYSMPAPAYPRAEEEKAAGGGESADRAAPAPSAGPASEAWRAKREESKAKSSERPMESAGTGYGREEYSPSYTVAFEPESRPAETIYVKYEWRATLCKLGVIDCDSTGRRPWNRLWDGDGYAPPPPGRS